MPAISLVVCVYRERALLERLLEHAQGCYDQLLVVHDGPEAGSETSPPLAIDFSAESPDGQAPAGYRTPPLPPVPGSIHELVCRHGGAFYEHPRVGSLEGQSAFAWSRAKYDWVFRPDADELPGEELKQWLQAFRKSPEPEPSISGYTCLWPLWNGHRATTQHWPKGRIFLFNKNRVRFLGMVENTPMPDGHYEPLPLVLHHQPERKSYGVRNILFRRQAYRWRAVIAQSLRGKPTDLSRWRWDSPEWPPQWETLRQRPLRKALISLIWFPLCQAKDMLRAGERLHLSACLNPGLHHFMLGLRVFWQNRTGPRS